MIKYKVKNKYGFAEALPEIITMSSFILKGKEIFNPSELTEILEAYAGMHAFKWKADGIDVIHVFNSSNEEIATLERSEGT